MFWQLLVALSLSLWIVLSWRPSGKLHGSSGAVARKESGQGDSQHAQPSLLPIHWQQQCSAAGEEETKRHPESLGRVCMQRGMRNMDKANHAVKMWESKKFS